MSIPRTSIARPVAVSMFFIAVVFLGLLSFRRLPVDLLPDVAYPRLVVHTSYPEVGPAEVEHFITEPVERAVSTVPGIERVESFTREGLSLVFLRFAWGTDMDFAALNVREKVDGLRSSLPETAERPTVLRQDPRSEPIMALSIAADFDLAELQDLTENVFRRRLEQIDGVAQASLTGGLEREIHVDVNQQRLDSYGLTIDQLSQALDAANAQGGSGTIRRGQFRYPLRTLGQLQAVESIQNIVLLQGAQGTDGSTRGRVLVRDVATVEDGFKDRESSATYNGKEALGLLIFKEAGANTVSVTHEVDNVVAELRQQFDQVTIETAMNQAGFITSAISNLVQNLVLGSVLAFLVLFLFLRDLRYPIAIALAIPISVIATFALLDAANVTLNIMSLGGLALGAGMLVDNSIVVLENFVRHREEKGLAAAAAAAVSTEELQRALLASTLTTVAVFGPVIYVQGVAGQLFRALSFAVAFSLLASLVVAISLLPMMAARWQRELARGETRAAHARTSFGRRLARPLDAFDRAFARFTDWYERTLQAALSHRRRVMLMAAAAFVLVIPLALSLNRSVLPDVDQSSFRAQLELPRGTPLEVTRATAERLDSIIRMDPDVEAVFVRVGKQTAIAGVQDEESDLNTATLEVVLRQGVGASKVLPRLRPKLDHVPTAALTLETGQATQLGQLLGSSEADLSVRIQGDDLDAALAYAEVVRKELEPVSEVTNVRIATELGQPEYLIRIDRDRAATFGLEAGTIARTIEDHMRGRVATKFVAFDRKIDVVVRLPEEQRRSLETLNTLFVNGIPLRDLVTVDPSVGPLEIQRIDQKRVVPVLADVTTGDVDGAVTAVRTALAATPVPQGLRVDIGGENEEMRQSFRDLAFAFMLALLLVYMILAAEFESFVHPFTILLSVPLSLIGALVALWIAGAGINTISMIGIVILIGICVNDAVVKIDYTIQLKARGLSTHEAIVEAGRARLRPILMTSLTTMGGVLPMMLGIGAGGGLQAPLAVAVFGGLVTSTTLTLIVIPVVYVTIEDFRERQLAKRGVATAAVPSGTPPEPVAEG